jgi:hypothetical protein
MKELMIHVERIVRPVRAMQWRKLRMRRELLLHLQAAFEEERGKGGDEAAALDRAAKRLGDPAELTRELQRSVPLIERTLLWRTPEKYNGWERRLATRCGLYQPVTFIEWMILHACGALALIIVCLVSPHVPQTAVAKIFADELVHPVRVRTAFIGVWCLQWVWLFMGVKFLGTAAAPEATFSLRRAVRDGITMLIVQEVVILLLVTQILRRPATLWEMALSIGVSLPLIGLTLLVGRWVSAMRRPYDEWLTLNLAS